MRQPRVLSASCRAVKRRAFADRGSASSALGVLLVLHVLLANFAVSAQVAITAPWLLSFASSTASRNEAAWYHPTEQLLVKLNEITSTCPHASAEWVVVLDPKPLLFAPSTNARPHGKLLVLTLSYNAKARARVRSYKARDERTRILAVFGEHGRERITSELALSIVRRYCEKGSVVHALRNLEIVLVPIVNVAGRHEAETSNACSRLNANGVDINRNYVVQWGRTDAHTVAEEETGGAHALSEWETRAIDALMRRSRPTAYLSFHSGERAILLPWDSGASTSGDMGPIAQRIKSTHCSDCRIGTASQLFGYRAYGTGVDHAVGVYGVPFACTLEIFGFEQKECKRMFNPMDSTEFASVVGNWSAVMETVGTEAVKLHGKSPRLGFVPLSWWIRVARWKRYRIMFLAESQENEEMGDYGSSGFVVMFFVACFCSMLFTARSTVRRLGKRAFANMRRRNAWPWHVRD